MIRKSMCSKKALALILSLGLCVGTIPMTNSYAATKAAFEITNPVSAMHVSRRYNLASTLNGKYADTSVTWTSSDPSIATVDKYGNVKTKKTGNVVITAKTKDGQKVSVEILSVSKSGLVDNQKDLERLLKSEAITSIAIRQTQRAKRFTIPAGDYSDKVVYINAGKSTLVNEGKLKTLTVVDLNTLKVNEVADKVYIKDEEVNVTVDEDAVVNKLYIPAGNVTTNLTVDGTVNVLLAGAKDATITMDGTGVVTTTYVTPNGEGVTVETAVPTTVKAKNDAKVVFTEGAEESKVELLAPTVEVKVENQTTEEIEVGDTVVAPGEENEGATTEPTPTPDADDDTDVNPAPTENTKLITAVPGVDMEVYYELPVDFRNLKSAVVITGGKEIPVNKTVINYVTNILDGGDKSVEIWKNFKGSIEQSVGGITITIKSTDIPEKKEVIYNGATYTVTVDGTTNTNVSIDVTKKGSTNTYTLTKEGARKLTIFSPSNSAVGELVSFKVTY